MKALVFRPMVSTTSVSPLVMADRFSVPGGFRIFRMGHVEIDVPHLMVLLQEDGDFLGRLDEVEWAALQIDSRNARGLAGRGRRVGDLAPEHLVIVLLHRVLRPLLQVGIGEIADPIGRLLALAVADEGMGRVLAHRTGRARHRDIIAAVSGLPRDAVRGKIGRRRGRLRRCGQRRSGNGGKHAARQKPFSGSKSGHIPLSCVRSTQKSDLAAAGICVSLLA